MFTEVAESLEVQEAIRRPTQDAIEINGRFHALIRREARAQGITLKELSEVSGEPSIKKWSRQSPSIYKIINVLDVLGYQIVALPTQELLDRRQRITADEQLRVAFLGAPNRILTREYLSAVIYPWETVDHTKTYKPLDVALVKMRRKHPDLGRQIKTHRGAGWEYTPGKEQDWKPSNDDEE